MSKHWRTEVYNGGDRILTIEHVSVSGKALLTDDDQNIIRIAGESLLGFIGKNREPVTEEWLVSEFDADKGAGEFMNRWCIHDDSFPIFLERATPASPRYAVWIAHIGDNYFPIDIRIREQVRLLVQMCHRT